MSFFRRKRKAVETNRFDGMLDLPDIHRGNPFPQLTEYQS